MQIIKLTSIALFSFISLNLHASMCTSHTSDNSNKYILKTSYEYPCEISDTILMASSEEVCLTLKEKISNHDHE